MSTVLYRYHPVAPWASSLITELIIADYFVRWKLMSFFVMLLTTLPSWSTVRMVCWQAMCAASFNSDVFTELCTFTFVNPEPNELVTFEKGIFLAYCSVSLWATKSLWCALNLQFQYEHASLESPPNTLLIQSFNRSVFPNCYSTFSHVLPIFFLTSHHILLTLLTFKTSKQVFPCCSCFVG